MTRISIRNSLALALLAAAVLACSTPAPAASPTAAAPAEPTSGPAQGGAAGNVSLGGVSFTLDPSLGTAAGAQLPADTAGSGEPEWLLPTRVEFELSGYPAASTRKAVIAVFPVADLKAINVTGGQRVDALAALLQTQPAGDAISGEIPQLSNLAQGEMLHAQVKYLDFANGSGVRFVTQFSSDVRPVSNQDLVYVFQGITSDGATYVALQLPVSETDLPAGDESMSAEQMDQLAQSFDQYIQETTGMLNQAADTSFSPSLAMLDHLVTSLSVNLAK